MKRFQQLATLAAAAAAALTMLHSPAALAQNYNPGVADVSVANGNVVIVRGDSGTQAGATINAPVVAGDYLSTGPRIKRRSAVRRHVDAASGCPIRRFVS